MKLPDETVMAYVDDELDAASRARVEAAMAADPEVRAQFKTQIELRARLRASFDPVLSEPVPERLLQTLGQESTVPSARNHGPGEHCVRRSRKGSRHGDAGHCHSSPLSPRRSSSAC